MDVLASGAYATAQSDYERAWFLTMAVCDALSPTVPRSGAVRRELEQRLRDGDIRCDFNGINYAELAAKHRLSTRQVRRIVDDPRKTAPRDLTR